MSYDPLPEPLRQPKAASEHTREAQRRIKAELNFEDTRSFEDAARGFIASLDPMTLQREDGDVSYDLEK